MENWGRLSHLFITVFLTNFAELMLSPAIPDVTLGAVCPGKEECSTAIYLTGFQQAISGIGSVIMTPLIGKLSDAYGRKTLLTVPLVLTIIPSAILSWQRTAPFFYAYYVIKIFTSMLTQGGVMCVALEYLADNVSVGNRISAFGVMSGVTSAAYVGGTLAARLLSTSLIFQVATALSVMATIYMRLFLKEKARPADALEEPILKMIPEANEDSIVAPRKVEFFSNIPSPKDVLRLLKRSPKFSLAASVVFFNSLAEGGLQACLMYFLKARFHFMKDQFAEVLLIAYIGATLSNMFFMPTLGPYFGEEILLSIGQFAGFLNMFFDSIAWAPWVPYASASTGAFLFLSTPNLRSIISKQVGPNEQGLAQGCIASITALSDVVSPLIFSPLSAFVLAENAPFRFQGFSVLCVGLAWLMGFFLSMIIHFLPAISRRRAVSSNWAEA